MRQIEVVLPYPHEKQQLFLDSTAKRKVIRAGRRAGKTVGMSVLAVEQFLDGKRVLYAAPTQEQIDRFWVSITRALDAPIRANVFKKNETRHTIEMLGKEQRIRAKTAWNADTLRGDYADLLILDEWQLMNEDAWELVGAPMLLDNNGDAVFVYTPPSLHSRSVSKANDPQHAAKLFKRASKDTTGRWQTFHFRSHDNPHLNTIALQEITNDMSALAILMEIDAEDIDEAPGALWNRAIIEKGRDDTKNINEMTRVVIGVDPTGSSDGDECGIIGAGKIKDDFYPLTDASLHGRPEHWATAAIKTYWDLRADCMVAEKNYGGEMVEYTIKSIDSKVNVKLVTATRGKAVRAEPISAIYEKGHGHHVGHFQKLEDEMCLWIPGDKSPNRLDAMVWAATELMLGKGGVIQSKISWVQ